MHVVASYIRISISVLLLALLAACGDTPVASLRVATNLWPGYEPLYLARSLELYKGTPIRLVELPSNSDTIRALRNGTVEAAALTLDETLLMLQDGIDVRILLVMDISDGADVIMARPEISSIEALKGKRIGVENFALGAYMLSRALESVGMTPEQVQVVALPVDRHASAYRDGSVDAVVTFDPVRSQLLAEGARVLFDSSRIPNEIVDVLVIRRDVLEKNPANANQLISGWFGALDYLRREPQQAHGIMAKREGLTTGQFADALQGLRFPDRADNLTMLTGKAPTLLPIAERLAKTMSEKNLLKYSVRPQELLTGTPLLTGHQ